MDGVESFVMKKIVACEGNDFSLSLLTTENYLASSLCLFNLHDRAKAGTAGPIKTFRRRIDKND